MSFNRIGERPMSAVVRISAATVLAAAILLLVACEGRESAATVAVQSEPETAEAPPTTGPSITYTSLPDPPHAGDNAVSVVVNGLDGAPISDLAVTATYFMPAMPSMNMPEMRDSFPLAHQADGRYAGNVRLSMGGTWIVTVTASRGEESVARKVFNIIAKE